MYHQQYFQGADLSFVPELEACGVKWSENSVQKDIFTIFKDHGANTIRFRIWHTPESGHNGFTETDSLIARAKRSGFKVMLDFHYSDTWTDPSIQTCPAAWSKVVSNNSALADSIYNYTKAVLTKLKNNNRMPDLVQVGNETNGGLCFSGDGTVTWPLDMTRQKLLFNAGIKAVREVDSTCKIILHVADPQHAEWWVGEFYNGGVTDFDIIGISYYPLWHTAKTLTQVGYIITTLKKTYTKDVMIVETGLPWSSSWDDNVTNVMSGDTMPDGTSSSAAKQAAWLVALTKEVYSSGGIGVIYWEPAWVASHAANCPADFSGSTWENLTFFDFNNNLMSNGGILYYNEVATTSIQTPDIATQNYHGVNVSLANNTLRLTCAVSSQAPATLSLYTLQGALLKAYTFSIVPDKTEYAFGLEALTTASKVIIARISSSENTSIKGSCLLRF